MTTSAADPGAHRLRRTCRRRNSSPRPEGPRSGPGRSGPSPTGRAWPLSSRPRPLGPPPRPSAAAPRPRPRPAPAAASAPSRLLGGDGIGFGSLSEALSRQCRRFGPAGLGFLLTSGIAGGHRRLFVPRACASAAAAAAEACSAAARAYLGRHLAGPGLGLLAAGVGLRLGGLGGRLLGGLLAQLGGRLRVDRGGASGFGLGLLRFRLGLRGLGAGTRPLGLLPGRRGDVGILARRRRPTPRRRPASPPRSAPGPPRPVGWLRRAAHPRPSGRRCCRWRPPGSRNAPRAVSAARNASTRPRPTRRPAATGRRQLPAAPAVPCRGAAGRLRSRARPWGSRRSAWRDQRRPRGSGRCAGPGRPATAPTPGPGDGLAANTPTSAPVPPSTASQSMSLVTLSHTQVPAVSTGSIRAAASGREPIQCAISWFTHSDAAAAGEANRMKYSDASSASVIDCHSAGLTDSPVSSRKMRRAWRRLHGLASRCSPRCRDGASSPSAAWL